MPFPLALMVLGSAVVVVSGLVHDGLIGLVVEIVEAMVGSSTASTQ